MVADPARPREPRARCGVQRLGRARDPHGGSVDRARAAGCGGLVLPRRRLRRARAVAGAARREARRRARRQTDQGGDGAGRRPRARPGRRLLRTRHVQVLRRRRAGGGALPALPAAAAGRRSERRSARDAARAQPRPAGAGRSRLPAPRHLSLVRTADRARHRAAAGAAGPLSRQPALPRLDRADPGRLSARRRRAASKPGGCCSPRRANSAPTTRRSPKCRRGSAPPGCSKPCA